MVGLHVTGVPLGRPLSGCAQRAVGGWADTAPCAVHNGWAAWEATHMRRPANARHLRAPVLADAASTSACRCRALCATRPLLGQLPTPPPARAHAAQVPDLGAALLQGLLGAQAGRGGIQGQRDALPRQHEHEQGCAAGARLPPPPRSSSSSACCTSLAWSPTHLVVGPAASPAWCGGLSGHDQRSTPVSAARHRAGLPGGRRPCGSPPLWPSHQAPTSKPRGPLHMSCTALPCASGPQGAPHTVRAALTRCPPVREWAT